MTAIRHMQITGSAVSLNVAEPTASAAFVRKHLGFAEEMADDGFVPETRGRRVDPVSARVERGAWWS
jgi:hypothetical protein